MGDKLLRSYYLERNKIIRDLVHGYINLTPFELKLITSVSFQRLKDIRQLTCQQVYPSANHTRFEHSLGVLELTRRAILYINKNGFWSQGKYNSLSQPIIDDNLEFNATIAALLHDVGHCPFSHLGEKEINSDRVRKILLNAIKENSQLKNCADLINCIRNTAIRVGAVHEQLSCIIILERYSKELEHLIVTTKKDEQSCNIEADFELIIRSILGIPYSEEKVETLIQNQKKNVIVRLINSDSIDMDKLDYIMRDSMCTGIAIAAIDVERLFRNMYLADDYSLLFAIKAAPVLQSIIDARDELYMYVYNHHVAIFSDYMNGYIFNLLSGSTERFYNVIYHETDRDIIDQDLSLLPVLKYGLVTRYYLYEAESIINTFRSDSDWTSLLNIVFVESLDLIAAFGGDTSNFDWKSQNVIDCIVNGLRGEVRFMTRTLQKRAIEWEQKPVDQQQSDLYPIAKNIAYAMSMIHRFKTRDYPKAWWKTVYEYTNFMRIYFLDKDLRRKLARWICEGGEYGLEAREFRSQLAKLVIFVVNKLYESGNSRLLCPMERGDLFVIERSNRFFSQDAINNIKIAISTKGMTQISGDEYSHLRGYYRSSLSDINPQKAYTKLYERESFYVFSSPVKGKTLAEEICHTDEVKRVFAFIASELLEQGEQNFIRQFQKNIVSKHDDNLGYYNELYSKYLSKTENKGRN